MHLTELEASEAAGAEKEPENWVPRHFADWHLVDCHLVDTCQSKMALFHENLNLNSADFG